MDAALALSLPAPVPVVVAILVIVVGLLLIRFVIGTAITILKVGILVAIGVAVFLGLQWLVGRF